MKDDLTVLAEFLDKANGRTIKVNEFTLTLDDGCGEVLDNFGCCASFCDAGILIDLLGSER